MMRRKLIRLSHYCIKGIIYLMYIAIVLQAVVYFVNPVRAESYGMAVDYWQGVWAVFFGVS